VTLRPQAPISALLPKDTDLSTVQKEISVLPDKLVAPVEAGTVLGSVRVSVNGEELGSVRLVASRSVELSKSEYMKLRVNEILTNKAVRAVIIVLAVLLVLYLLLVARYRYLRRKHLKERKRAAMQRRMEEERRRRRAEEDATGTFRAIGQDRD